MSKQNFLIYVCRCLFLFTATLLASVTYGQSDSTTREQRHKRPDIYLLVDKPAFGYSSDKNYLKTNFFQGGGIETEVLFKKRFGICLDFYINNSHQNYNQGDVIIINKKLSFTPTVKFYIDQYAKLYVAVGSQLSFTDAKKTIAENEIELSQRYWTNILRLEAGYKIYMFKKKRFGIELAIGSNLMIWGNPEEWTGALANRGLYANFSLFYKF